MTWFLKMLIDVHNMQRMALDFAEQYQKYGDGLLSHVI
jgi:hypothetical protein